VNGLTGKQRDVLQWVERYCTGNGFAPSLREISEHFGWGSTRPARKHLDAIAKKGKLRRESGVARGIRLTRRTTK